MASTCRAGTRCAECSQSHDTREHKTVAPKAASACAVCQRIGHTAYDSRCPWKVKEKKRTTKRLANKPSYYYPQRTARGKTTETAEIAEEECTRLETSLRAKFEDIKKQGRKPTEEEGVLIQDNISRIRVLRAETKQQ